MRRITIRVPDDLHEFLVEEAKATQRRLSDVVRTRLDSPPKATPSVPIPTEGERLERVVVYLNAEELAQVRHLASGRRVTLSNYFRTLGLAHRLPPALTVFQQIRAELSAQGNNLNQLVHLAHVLGHERGFPGAELVERVLQETIAAWKSAGDRLDHLLMDIEGRNQ